MPLQGEVWAGVSLGKAHALAITIIAILSFVSQATTAPANSAWSDLLCLIRTNVGCTIA